MKPFDAFEYLWPPRPTRAVTPAQFDFFERRGWVAQLKLNGTCAIIGLGPDEQVELWNRHQQPLNWDMPTAVHGTLRNINMSPKWTVLVAELIHNKVSGGPRNTLFLHDVLVWRGDYLIGETYTERYARLHTRFRTLTGQQYEPTPGEKLACISENIWLGTMVPGNPEQPGVFREMFDAIDAKQQARGGGSILTEGIVMKDPNARLEPCTRESANDSWSAKCRFGTKNYSH